MSSVIITKKPRWENADNHTGKSRCDTEMENKKHINLQVKKYIGQCNYLKCKSQPSMKGKKGRPFLKKKKDQSLWKVRSKWQRRKKSVCFTVWWLKWSNVFGSLLTGKKNKAKRCPIDAPSFDIKNRYIDIMIYEEMEMKPSKSRLLDGKTIRTDLRS